MATVAGGGGAGASLDTEGDDGALGQGSLDAEGLREMVFILKFGLCLSVLLFLHLFFVRCFAWLNI
jgi:hypothetical protein